MGINAEKDIPIKSFGEDIMYLTTLCTAVIPASPLSG
jgi:hypothetical protein